MDEDVKLWNRHKDNLEKGMEFWQSRDMQEHCKQNSLCFYCATKHCLTTKKSGLASAEEEARKTSCKGRMIKKKTDMRSWINAKCSPVGKFKKDVSGDWLGLGCSGLAVEETRRTWRSRAGRTFGAEEARGAGPPLYADCWRDQERRRRVTKNGGYNFESNEAAAALAEVKEEEQAAWTRKGKGSLADSSGSLFICPVATFAVEKKGVGAEYSHTEELGEYGECTGGAMVKVEEEAGVGCRVAGVKVGDQTRSNIVQGTYSERGEGVGQVKRGGGADPIVQEEHPMQMEGVKKGVGATPIVQAADSKQRVGVKAGDGADPVVQEEHPRKMEGVKRGGGAAPIDQVVNSKQKVGVKEGGGTVPIVQAGENELEVQKEGGVGTEGLQGEMEEEVLEKTRKRRLMRYRELRARAERLESNGEVKEEINGDEGEVREGDGPEEAQGKARKEVKTQDSPQEALQEYQEAKTRDAQQTNNVDENQNLLPNSDFVYLTPPKLSVYPMAENSGNNETCASDEEKSSAEFISFSPIPEINEVKKPRKRRNPAAEAKQLNRLLDFQEKLVIEKGLPKSRLQTERDLGMTPIPTLQMTPTSTSPMMPILTSTPRQSSISSMDSDGLEGRGQARICPFALRDVSVPTKLALGHLRYHLTDVPPQPQNLAASERSHMTGCASDQEYQYGERVSACVDVDSEFWQEKHSGSTTSFPNQDTFGARRQEVGGNLRGYKNRFGATVTGFCWGCRRFGYISQIGNNVFCWFCKMYGYILLMPVTVISY